MMRACTMLLVAAATLAGTAAAQDNAGKGVEKPGRAALASKKGADAFFSKLDRNGDGVITRDEIPKPERFDALDADKDGKVPSAYGNFWRHFPVHIPDEEAEKLQPGDFFEFAASDERKPWVDGGVVLSVVTSVTTGYIALRALDRQLEIARATAALARAARRAEACGVTYCIEPLSRRETDLINTVAEAVALVDWDAFSTWAQSLLTCSSRPTACL